jgi:hypothetical protein
VSARDLVASKQVAACRFEVQTIVYLALARQYCSIAVLQNFEDGQTERKPQEITMGIEQGRLQSSQDGDRD